MLVKILGEQRQVFGAGFFQSTSDLAIFQP